MQVLPRSKSIMQLLFFGLYLFASLGMFWYGGLITRGKFAIVILFIQNSILADSLL